MSLPSSQVAKITSIGERFATAEGYHKNCYEEYQDVASSYTH